jgi:hypothetical protein
MCMHVWMHVYMSCSKCIMGSIMERQIYPKKMHDKFIDLIWTEIRDYRLAPRFNAEFVRFGDRTNFRLSCIKGNRSANNGRKQEAMSE